MAAQEGSLLHAFLSSAARHPSRTALEVEGGTISYADLLGQATCVAAAIRRPVPADGRGGMVAVLGGRSAATYTGILGALLAGQAYVPLSPLFPPARLRSMLERSGARCLVSDPASAALASSLLGPDSSLPLLVVRDPPERGSAAWTEPSVGPESPAYLLFTSGSTGEPKGVAISGGSVMQYLRTMRRRLKVTECDRFSQLFELGFDLSVSDLFLPWTSGACVCVPLPADLRKPDRYIRDAALTVWFSTPSHAALMQRLGVLKPGAYPGLRASLFCGEALPVETARAWSLACPNSVVDNLYGPTEATIACTAHRWDPARSPAQTDNGIVPIGEPLPGTLVRVADDTLREVPTGEPGELLLSGLQLAAGYWRDPERTAASFVTPPGWEGRWYRTGDRVRMSAAGELLFLGRTDQQLKLRGGFRVELGEIEAVARGLPGVRAAVALGWPMGTGAADGIELFVEGENLQPAEVRQALAALLPPYMLPRTVRVLAAIPVNHRGKCDRLALAKMLDDNS